MTEMEFFQLFELRPVRGATRPTVECWKRDSGLYGQIIQWDEKEFHVREGGNLIRKGTTFGQALKALVKHVSEVVRT